MNLDQRLIKISRDLFINRCILIFIALCVGIMLFLPGLAASIAETSARLLPTGNSYFITAISIILGIGIVVGVAAFIAYRLPSAPREPKEPLEY
jgi:hypothetical protein